MSAAIDIDLEDTSEALISCLLLEDANAVTLRKCRESKITARSFVNQEHSEIYRIIETLHDKGISDGLQAEIIRQHPKHRDSIIQLTGIDSVQTSTHLAKYIGDLKNAESRHKMQAMSALFGEQLKTDRDLRDVLADHKERIASLEIQHLRLSAISAAEICRTPPATPFPIVEGMLFRGGTMMLSAPSKGHKTYTALDLAVAVAAGREWLGFKTTATPVLYLNLELPPFAASQRLKAICHSRGIEPPANLFLLNLRGKRVTVETLAREIMPYAKSINAGLVVIDPYYKLASVSGVEENSNDGQAIFLADLEAASAAGDCAIFLLHHFAKGDSGAKNSIDRASGGGVLARWPDVIGTLTEHETEECMVAEFHLRVYAPIPPFVVRWCCPVWIREIGEDPAKIKRAGRGDEHPARVLLEKLDPHGMTNSEWVKVVGWSATTHKNKRDQLESAGKVKCVMGVWKPC